MPLTKPSLAHLPDRAVLQVTGADRVGFLNGLVSNDVARAAPGHAIWAALLSPQGKYLADFFIFADGERLLLDVAAGQAEMLTQRLIRFRLRADVHISPTDLSVYTAWGAAPEASGVRSAPDPRLPDAGWRLLSATKLPTDATLADWDKHRIAHGLPDGARDLEIDKTVLLEAGFDELGGISWTKGCYMGQELTARTRYRGLLKRRLLPVSAPGALPPPGTAILAGAREAGTLRSACGQTGLAVLRLDCLTEKLTVAGQELVVAVPDWVKLPAEAG